MEAGTTLRWLTCAGGLQTLSAAYIMFQPEHSQLTLRELRNDPVCFGLVTFNTPLQAEKLA